MDKPRQRLIHRRTFQNVNQVVELTVRAIPKSDSLPKQLLKKDCLGMDKIAGRVDRDKSKASEVTVNVYQKGRENYFGRKKEDQRKGKADMVPQQRIKENEGARDEYGMTPDEEGRKENKKVIYNDDPDLSSSISSSSFHSHLRKKKKKITESNIVTSTHPSHQLLPVSEHSTPRPLSSSQPLPASTVHPPAPPSSTTTNHPNQVPHNGPLLSDDTTPSPFGNSAIVYLRRLRQLLEDRGLGEEGAFLGVIEAFISSPGSGDIIRKAPSLPTPNPTFVTITPTYETTTTTATLHSVQHNSNIVDAEKLRKIIEEKDGVINELKTLSSNLIIQQEMMLKKTDEPKRDEREEREKEIEEKEMIKREAEKFKEESEKLRQEIRKLREHTVNLEIQLARTSRLLEIERGKSTSRLTSPTVHNPTITTSDSTTNRPTCISPVQESPNSRQNQTGHLYAASVHSDDLEGSHNNFTRSLNPPINNLSCTAYHELNKPTRLPPSLNESEIDSAYERTPSQITSKASTPSVSLLRNSVNLSSNRSGEAGRKNEGALEGQRDSSSSNGSKLKERSINVRSTTKEYQHHLAPPPPPPPPPPSSSFTRQRRPESPETSTHLQDTSSARLEKDHKMGLSEFKLIDHIQKWISQSSINVSSASTFDEAETNLISSLSTQESSFFQGIVENRYMNTCQNEPPQFIESGTRVLESTRVSGSDCYSSNTKFEKLEPGTLSTEDLKKCVQLLD